MPCCNGGNGMYACKAVCVKNKGVALNSFGFSGCVPGSFAVDGGRIGS